MSDVLAAIAAGHKPMIGMIQLRALPGSSRFAGGSLAGVLEPALRDAAILRAAGFAVLMVQNLGDLPVAAHASPAQVAWMTRIAHEIRREHGVPVGVNFLENDAAAMFAVASAADLDFVRIKVFTGAMVTPGGIEAGQAFAAIRARTAWNAGRVAIFADVHDRTASPVATAGLADDIRSAFALGGADGIVLTGRTHRETLDFLQTARAAFADRPILVGGGVCAQTVAEITTLADGAIVSSALKTGNDLFGEIDAKRARAFVDAARDDRATRVAPRPSQT